MSNVINILSKFDLFSDEWSPKVIAELNDYQFKVVKICGELVWHNHTETDEAFIVIEGSMGVEFKDKMVHLAKGEMIVIKKGEMHRTFAEKQCKLLVIEPKGVINTGDELSNQTAENDVWI